ncbi:MAG TPA: SPOR domain-containing protein [Thermoanaerobaculia bacterium]
MEPRTHYQISLTARQAVGIFVGLLLALGLAFFFGLMTGLSGRGRANARGPEPAETLAEARPAAETLPAVETAAPPPRREAPRGEAARGEAPRRSEPGPPAGSPGAASAAEPTPPQTLETFEDGGAEEPTPATPSAAPSSVPTAHAGAGSKPTPATPPSAAGAGRVWVQVASVSSRNEAETVSSRLSKRGYHAVVSAERGRLRVRVGPYRTTEEARRAADRLRKQEKVKSPWVVFEGK